MGEKGVASRRIIPGHIPSDSGRLAPTASQRRLSAGLAALASALAIVNLPRTPFDVAQRNLAVPLPITLAGFAHQPIPLEPREQAFFTQVGGSAVKGLMLVRTTSPLRHLHTPGDCLRGIGFRVAYLGAEFSPVPTAVYRAIAPDGARYRIDVSFVSDRGEVTSNVATASGNGDARAWTAVQRISPEQLPEHQHAQWAAAVIAALELGRASSLSTEKGDRE